MGLIVCFLVGGSMGTMEVLTQAALVHRSHLAVNTLPVAFATPSASREDAACVRLQATFMQLIKGAAGIVPSGNICSADQPCLSQSYSGHRCVLTTSGGDHVTAGSSHV